MLVLTIFLLASGCLAFDLLTPSSTGEWGLYLIPLLLTAKARQPRYPLFFAGVCTALTVAGFWFSVPTVGFKAAFMSRMVGIVVFWIVGVLLMERKKAELSLQSQQHRLQAILDHSPLAIFLKDTEGRYLEFSRQCELNTRLIRAEVLGKTDRQLFPPAEAEDFVKSDQAVIKSREAFEGEVKFTTPDGEHTHLVIKFPLFDLQGNCNSICGVSADVTRLKKIEQTLWENQEAIAFSNRRLSLLAQVTAVVVGAAPLREEGRKLAEKTMAAFDVDACVIRRLDEGGLLLVANAGFLDGYLPASIPADHGTAHDIMATRRPVFFPDVRGMTSNMIFTKTLSEEHRFISYAGAPLLVQDQVIGVLGIYSKKMMHFSETDLEHLQIAANHIAVAIANDCLFKEVRVQKDQLAEQIAERQRAETALNEAKERLQSLSRRLLEMQEMERRHIARELHDEIGQALTALKINMQAVQRLPETQTSVPRLLDSINIVDRTLRQVRNLSLDLRPSMLDDFGLCAALRWYTDQQAQRAGLQVQFIASPLEGRLEPTLETACFRVAQEALTNIVRHAQAGKVVVKLEEETDFLHLTVKDDGIGFDLDSVQRHLASGASLGLLGMKERASLMGGRVELRSAPGEGTEVHGWFPRIEAAPEPQRTLELTSK